MSSGNVRRDLFAEFVLWWWDPAILQSSEHPWCFPTSVATGHFTGELSTGQDWAQSLQWSTAGAEHQLWSCARRKQSQRLRELHEVWSEIWGVHEKQGVGEFATGRNERRRLTSCKPDGNSATALPPAITASLCVHFPSWEPSFRITVVPLFIFQLTPSNKKTLFLHFCLFLSSPSN